MKLSKIFVIVLTLIIALSFYVIAEEAQGTSDIGIVGGADGPTTVFVTDSDGNSKSFTIEDGTNPDTGMTVHTFKESDLEATEESDKGQIKLNFEPMNFVKNLDIMGKGMLGIFIVIGIIIVAVYILGAFNKSKKD